MKVSIILTRGDINRKNKKLITFHDNKISADLIGNAIKQKAPSPDINSSQAIGACEPVGGTDTHAKSRLYSAAFRTMRFWAAQ